MPIRLPRRGCVLIGLLGIASWSGLAIAQDRQTIPVTGSTILETPVSAWDQYKLYIIVGGLFLAALQAGLIAALLVQRSRRRSGEAALRESEERFHLMADTAPVLVWRAGTDKLCDFFNRPWLEFTGRALEQELGNGWSEGVHPDDLDDCLRLYVKAFDARQPFRMDYRLRRADGAYRWILDTGVPRYGTDGTFAGYIGSCVDITDRRDAEHALRENQERYTLATATGKVGVWDMNLETNEVFVDAEIKRILGLDGDDISSHWQAWQARVHPDDFHAVVSAAQACIAGTTAMFEIEHRIVAEDGSTRWCLGRGSVMRRPDGTPFRMLGTATDITERKRAEEQFRMAIDAAPSGMLLVDGTGRIGLVNSAIEKMFGFSREELIGRPVGILVPEPLRGQHSDHVTGFQRHPTNRPMGAGLELFGLRRDGREIPIEVGLSHLQTPQGDVILCSIADITERHLAERERESLTRRLRRLAGQLITAQETERARIARDLHDDVSQELAGLSIGLSGLKRRLGAEPGSEALRDDASSLQQRVGTLAKAVRELSHDLHPAVLQHAGLVAALGAHIAELQGPQTAVVTFEAEGDFASVEPSIALCLYRVAQEALRNVMKHATARHATIRLLCTSDGIELTIADDGEGFDVVRARASGQGLGLVSITERVRLLGGTVGLVTEWHKGTRLHVQIPTHQPAQADGRSERDAPPA